MGELDIRIWEVGAGLCVRIKTPNGQNHIIDAGRSDDFSPAEHIYKYHWNDDDELNYLIISHQDSDHVADLPNIRKYLGDPKTLLRNKSVPDDQKYGLLRRLYQKILKFFDEKYTVSTPWETDPSNPANNGGVRIEHKRLDWADAETINNSSIVVAYEYKGVVVIFPGDIESDGWDKLISKNPRIFENLLAHSEIVVLVAPHHGRANGYSQNMIDYLKPHLIVISDGFGAGETDPRFRTCALGLIINGKETKYITTKTKGRKRITIKSDGSMEIHEAD